MYKSKQASITKKGHKNSSKIGLKDISQFDWQHLNLSKDSSALLYLSKIKREILYACFLGEQGHV